METHHKLPRWSTRLPVPYPIPQVGAFIFGGLLDAFENVDNMHGFPYHIAAAFVLVALVLAAWLPEPLISAALEDKRNPLLESTSDLPTPHYPPPAGVAMGSRGVRAPAHPSSSNDAAYLQGMQLVHT